jgi:hypothetical protein
MASWEGFSIQLPGQDLLEPVRNVLETLLVFLEVLKTILETVKAFLLALLNPIEALVKALIQLIETLVQALDQTGLYAYFDIPDPTKDPNFFKYVGGYQAFTGRFKGSLLDSRDPNRPQPIAGATQSGFILLVADAVGPVGLLRLIKILLKFFSRDFIMPRFAAPANVKIFPVNNNTTPVQPINSLAKAFSIQANAVSLSWTLGGGMQPPDPGFTDLAGIVANEFIPPQWLIERSSTPINNDIDVGASGVGRVTASVPTLHETRGIPGQFYNQTIHLTDDHGEPIIKFDTYQTLTLGDDSGNILTTILNGLIGELGFIQWFDTENIQSDQTYYYRLRAYTGTLDINGTQLNWATTPLQNPKTRKWYLPWPGDNVVVGNPSGIFRVRVPKIPPNFDVIQNLTNLFIAGFALNFQAPVTQAGQKDGTGASVPQDTFDAAGNPTGTTPPWAIGKGTLTRYAGVLGGLLLQPEVTSNADNATVSALTPNSPLPTNGGVEVQQPFQNKLVRLQANRLAGVVGSAFLEQGYAATSGFQQVMQGAFPRGPLTPSVRQIKDATNLQQLCANIIALDADGNYTLDTYQAYIAAYKDPSCRKNIQFALQYVTNFLHGGVPPDWVRISILRDLIPWVGQLVYDLIAKIQALVDAFKGIFEEIAEFISAIERKITVLEQFIEFLISILDFILSLSVGFYLLSVQSSGSVFDWFSQIDNATGTVPPSGPGGYSAGIALAYVAVDPGPFATAFGLIF